MKNKKKVIFVIIGLLIILVACGVIFYFINKDANVPEDVLKQYVEYINEQKYDEMYELLSDESKSKTSKETFLTRNKNIYDGIEAKNVNVKTVVREEKDKTKLSYQMEMSTVAGEVSFFNEMSFTRQDDKKYYINWDSSLIFPDLTESDKIRVETSQGDRGKILDRNGIVLAEQGTIKRIGFVPGKMTNKLENIAVASKLLGVTEDFIQEEISASYVKDDTFVPIKTLSNEDEEEIEDKLLAIPGIMISDKKARVYSYGKATSHLLGYVRTISSEELEQNKDKGYTSNSIIGKSGMEKVFEDTLKGTNGAEIYILDSNGNKKKTIAETTKQTGKDVRLTIDVALQNKIYQELDGDNGFSVAINPKTGEVLAMVSTPTFDSNDFIVGFTNDEWDNLNNDKNNPMFCRYQNTYVPGSSFKPITGAVGLTTGKFTSSDDFGKSGLSWQNNESWGSYKITTLTEYNATANLKNALIYSDNIYFAKAALKIGQETFTEQLQKIGFNKDIPFEQNMSKSQFATDNQFASEVQLADTGYGQGEVLVNPLHIASIYSAFVNDGNMIKPYIEYTSSPKSEYWIENAFSKEAANTIKEDLIQVVENVNGTAHAAQIKGMTLAGKTGTAEIKASKDDDNGTELGWFNAFRVSDNVSEQLLIVNMIEDVKDRGGSHYLLSKVKNMFQ